MTQYQTNYRHGYDAGREYNWPADTPTLYRDEQGKRTVRGHGTMPPSAAAGFMRGFRHGCMDQR